MTSYYIKLPEDLELKFREIAMRKFGFRRGSLTKASVEAISQWIALNEKGSTTEGQLSELMGRKGFTGLRL